SRELVRTINEVGHTLGLPRGVEQTDNSFRNMLEKVRRRCHKMAARLGCCSSGADVFIPHHIPTPLPQSARPSLERSSVSRLQHQASGGASSSRTPRGKAPAPPSDDDEDEEEDDNDEDYTAEDAEEIGPSQLHDAPEPSQPTQVLPRRTHQKTV
ncbi:hypothetical protein E2562_004101, partial [Oryza meyeriana var. granulata]